MKWLSGSTLARAVKLDCYRRLTIAPAMSLLGASSWVDRNQDMLLQLLRVTWYDLDWIEPVVGGRKPTP